MQLQPMLNFAGLEIPDYDICWETWEACLGAYDVFAITGDFYAWVSEGFTGDFAVVAAEESLGSR